jgi:hypothetical protein
MLGLEKHEIDSKAGFRGQFHYEYWFQLYELHIQLKTMKVVKVVGESEFFV